MKKWFTLNPLSLSIIIVIAGTIAYLAGIPFLNLIELKTIDLRFRSRGPIAPGPQIVLAVIDEKSIDAEGKWVWPREKFATLVKKLDADGARVIAFDIGFLEPDNQRVLKTVQRIQQDFQKLNIHRKDVSRYLDNLEAHADADKALAEAIRNAKAKVVLGYFFHMGSSDLRHVDTATVTQQKESIRNGLYNSIRYQSRAAEKTPLIHAQLPQPNIPVIDRSSPYAGYFNMVPDEDGVVRWIPAVIKFGDNLYAPMSLMAVRAYLNVPLTVNISESGVESIDAGDLRIPTDKYGRILVNYRGPQKSFPHISVTDILHDRVPASALRDKIVMVGATAVGIFDLRVTPFSTVFPGLEIHANMASSILESNFLSVPNWAPAFDLLSIIAGGLLLGLVLNRLGALLGGAFTLTLFGVHIYLCQMFFTRYGSVVNMTYPMMVYLFVYIGITGFKYVSESQQKRFIKDAFSTYLAPTVVKQLIDSPESLVLGGEEREITAFFSDVQGFTSISEKLSPSALVELLNEFLTEMTDVILEHEGTVDKFEGDAIIAFFGAPNYMENHAEVACMACIRMQTRLAELRKKWRSEGKPELHMRIGLCSGTAVVGNMGSKNRMDYTMMGDTVNTAARLEGVNKIYGIYTLIGDTTRNAAGDAIVTREVDAINVIGKLIPITVYEVLGYSGQTNPARAQAAAIYEQGLAAYRNRDWNQAIIHFNQALAVVPDDGPSRTMIARCHAFKQTPPPTTWNGAHTMTQK